MVSKSIQVKIKEGLEDVEKWLADRLEVMLQKVPALRGSFLVNSNLALFTLTVQDGASVSWKIVLLPRLTTEVGQKKSHKNPLVI